MEEIIKETITSQNINFDSKMRFKALIKLGTFAYAGLLLLIIYTLVPLCIYDGKEKIIFIYLISIFIGMFVLLTIRHFYIIKEYIIIKQKKFNIVKDKLTDKKAENLSRHHRRPHRLVFKKYGEYSLSPFWHYSYSNQFTMFDNELFRTSDIDDEFYLVTDNKEKILLVYNTKYFDIAE